MVATVTGAAAEPEATWLQALSKNAGAARSDQNVHRAAKRMRRMEVFKGIPVVFLIQGREKSRLGIHSCSQRLNLIRAGRSQIRALLRKPID